MEVTNTDKWMNGGESGVGWDDGEDGWQSRVLLCTRSAGGDFDS